MTLAVGNHINTVNNNSPFTGASLTGKQRTRVTEK